MLLSGAPHFIVRAAEKDFFFHEFPIILILIDKKCNAKI